MNLADEYAAIKTQIDNLTKDLEVIKVAIHASGKEVIEGETATVTVSLCERQTLDQTAVKKLLTPELLASVTKTSLIESIRLKLKLQAQPVKLQAVA